MKNFNKIGAQSCYYWKDLKWLKHNEICFIIFRPKVDKILNFELFLSLKFPIKFLNQVLEGKINSITCSHLEKTRLPCNLSKISSHIWLFKNWIYTLHNNVHMLNSSYIYVMGSHLDQLCIPHYIPCYFTIIVPFQPSL
jgi:hypothetical protein